MRRWPGHWPDLALAVFRAVAQLWIVRPLDHVMNCPKCNSPMEKGWLAIYEPLPITRLLWQSVQPGWVRFRMPHGSVRVIQPRAWGRGCPEGFICKNCKITLFSYDEQSVSHTFEGTTMDESDSATWNNEGFSISPHH